MEYEMILELLETRKYKILKDVLENYYPVDIAEFMEELDEKQVLILFRLLDKDNAAETFSYMNSDVRETLINALTDSELEEVIEEMYLDDVADVVGELPANVVDRLLMATDEETRQQINSLLKYPDNSAGSVMNVEYIGLRPDMTVEEAILKIRQVGINKETIYTCYVTDKRKLIGVVDVKDLLTNSDTRTMEEIMDTNVLYAHTLDDQEDVAQMINKYGLVAIPIVDTEGYLVGIVTVDDAMEVLQDETTEDMSMMAGIINPAEDTYFGTSAFAHAKSRSVWLIFLMLSATFSGLVLDHYSPVILAMPVLNAFVPMLTGTGGNCGSQSSTLIIRGLTVGEIEFKDIFRVILKEIRVAVLVGVFLAIINGIRVVIMYQGKVDNAFLLAAVLGATLICTIIMAKVVGCTLPLIAEKIGLDPAIMAAPLITTIVDTGTTLVYFTIVCHVFNLTV